jgi:hypothetical protein
MKQVTITMATTLLVAGFYCCNSSTTKEETPKQDKDTTVTATTTAATASNTTAVDRPGIVNIIDTVSIKRTVLYMKDSAKTFERISMKLGIIYGQKLGEVLKKNKITMTGAPMAWYKSDKAPYFFEAGVPVSKAPTKLPAGIFVKEMGIDSVVVAHFFGPYNLLSQGYTAIRERMKDAKQAASGAPYEIYVDDPVDSTGKMKDPYKVQTDIIFPRK